MNHQTLEIINYSLKFGEIPSCLKTSIVVPISKVTNSIKSEDKRAINTLSVFDNIMEKSVKTQLENYFEDNKLLIEEQHGFRRNHSCETSLNVIINQWKADIDSGKIIIIVSIDFKRAFETISRSLFLQKCRKYGFTIKALKWFENYFENRTQKTKIENVTSSELNNDIGIKEQCCHASYSLFI